MGRAARKAPAKETAQKQPVVVSCVNLKGGVGKTTLSVNFAAYCGRKGLRTLLIDLDPQTNASFAAMGVEAWEKHSKKKGTIADLIGARSHTSAEGRTKEASDIIVRGVFPKVDLV